jgi:transposase
MAACGASNTGAPWRDLPEKHGKWMTVYQRFRRWSEAGIWEAVTKARPGLDWAAFHFNPRGEIQLY